MTGKTTIKCINNLPRWFHIQGDRVKLVILYNEMLAGGVTEDHARQDGAVIEIAFQFG